MKTFNTKSFFTLGCRMVLLGLVAGGFSSVQAAEDIYEMRLGSTDQQTRLVFELSNKVAVNIRQLESPPRLLVDLQEAFPLQSLARSQLKDERIKRIRVTENDKTYRMILDLNHAVVPKMHYLPNSDKGDVRLALDLYDAELEVPQGKKAVPRLDTPAQKVSAAVKTQSKASAMNYQHPSQLSSEFVVALDAGHGGRDSGAPGQHSNEKDLTLALTQKLADQINAIPGFKAVLTRTGDYYLGLTERTQIAQDAGADLFLSVHANWFEDKRVAGASLYTLNREGAYQEIDRLLKEENGKFIQAALGVDTQETDVLLTLSDLARASSMSESNRLANEMLKHMKKDKINLLQGKAYHEDFRVLKNLTMPSVLIETGFISNPKEEALLNSPEYQEKLAKSIKNAVVAFAKSRNINPISTHVAKTQIDYKVKKGDTLSEIAQRYNTDIQTLMTLNKKKTSTVYLNEKIKIPYERQLVASR